MNAEGRNRIKALVDQLEDVKIELQESLEEEETKYDNLPEGLQESEAGEKLQEAIDSLTEADGSLDDVISALEGLI